MDRGEKLQVIDAYWKAANYLSAAQIYLKDNPLLRRPLAKEDIKPRLLGHWGTCPGLNFIYAHLNRVISERGTPTLFIAGPGHGGPAMVANTWLEGSWSEHYPDMPRNLEGLKKLVRSFSWPGGIPSHVAPQVPGSIHEGGELGYSLSHAFGAVLDQPELTAACVVGDGEAETAALAAAWPLIHFLNPDKDGAVLPIIHLNGYKISGPTVLGRLSDERLLQLFTGLGYSPVIVNASSVPEAHRAMAAALDDAYDQLAAGRAQGAAHRCGPMIILRSPKGWTGPLRADGHAVEGSFRSHQVPLQSVREDTGRLRALETWLKSYHPDILFKENGAPLDELLAVTPKGNLRMGSVPQADAGREKKKLLLPDFTEFMLELDGPGSCKAEATRRLGLYLREVMQLNHDPDNFRIFCPDETRSNRLDAALEAAGRRWLLDTEPEDEDLSAEGRVIEILSEHCCQGLMEGYLLTGRHALFPCYEAFITIVDSMVNQYAKWLKMSRETAWRRPPASMNYLLTSHAWRQDHNGYSHQGPGFINTLLQKKKETVRIYLPPDANTLLSVADHCLRSENYINLIICGKQPEWQWLDQQAAVEHCRRGASVWDWAGTAEGGQEPDAVLACAGDVPTQETLAACQLLSKHVPGMKTRVVNVVDLMTLPQDRQHPHGLSDAEFVSLFTEDIPVIFAFHGYPRAIHELIYKRPHNERFHVHGYIEEGTTTTPFDMTVCNRISRYHLALDAIKRSEVASKSSVMAAVSFRNKLNEHRAYIREHGQDMDEIREWKWDSSAVEPVGAHAQG